MFKFIILSFCLLGFVQLELIGENICKSIKNWKTVEKCCEGFVQKARFCLPFCENGCDHGFCEEPNKCFCFAGFTGPSCEIACDADHWGMDCKHKCKCKSCDRRNGTCSGTETTTTKTSTSTTLEPIEDDEKIVIESGTMIDEKGQILIVVLAACIFVTIVAIAKKSKDKKRSPLRKLDRNNLSQEDYHIYSKYEIDRRSGRLSIQEKIYETLAKKEKNQKGSFFNRQRSTIPIVENIEIAEVETPEIYVNTNASEVTSYLPMNQRNDIKIYENMVVQ